MLPGVSSPHAQKSPPVGLFFLGGDWLVEPLAQMLTIVAFRSSCRYRRWASQRT